MVAFFKFLTKLLLFVILLGQVCFFSLRIIPGGPFSEVRPLTSRQAEILKEQWGLGESLYQQWWKFSSALLSGDFGTSLVYQEKVTTVISRSWGVSLVLGSSAIVFLLSFTLMIMYWGYFPRFRKAVFQAQFFLSSIPNIVLVPIVIWTLVMSFDFFPRQPGEELRGWILPVLVLGLRSALNLSRLILVHLEEKLLHPSTDFYRALGFSDKRIWLLWVRRGGWAPVLSYFPILVASLLTGSLVVETLFAISGLGSLLMESFRNADYPVITTLLILFGAIMIFVRQLASLILAAQFSRTVLIPREVRSGLNL